MIKADVAGILKRVLQDLKKTSSKGEIKPKYLEFIIEGGSALKLNQLKSIFRESIGHFNLEYIDSLRFKIENEDLTVIFESKDKNNETAKKN